MKAAIHEDVCKASVLRFFIPSFKGFYDEYLLEFFFTICWSLNLWMTFFPSKTWLQISPCLWLLVSVREHPLNKDVFQVILALFISTIFKRWVAFKFLFSLCWSSNRLNVSFNFSYCDSCLLCVWKEEAFKSSSGAHVCVQCGRNFCSSVKIWPKWQKVVSLTKWNHWKKAMIAWRSN